MRFVAASRASALAMWQSEHVSNLIRSADLDSEIDVEILKVSTSGDRDLASPIHAIGGKGVFVKEVQAAVLEGRADFAVHSAKDLPAETPSGLVIAAVPERADVRDVLVGASIEDLQGGGTVGTGSVRRRAQLAALTPAAEFVELRGNIDSRLARVGELDAIIMAAAALERLGRTPAKMQYLDVSMMVPQVGQGALAIECRVDDERTRAILDAIDDPSAHRRLNAERAFLVELGGDCDLPAGAVAELDGDEIVLDAMLSDGTPDCLEREVVRGTDPIRLGTDLASELRTRLP